MAAAAGMKPAETDTTPPCDVWIVLDGYERRERVAWERTRIIAYNVAKFGNSDSKKFPASLSKFFPFPWDEQDKPNIDTILEQHARKVALRESLRKQQANG